MWRTTIIWCFACFFFHCERRTKNPGSLFETCVVYWGLFLLLFIFGKFSRRLSWKINSRFLLTRDADMAHLQSIYRFNVHARKKLLCLPHGLALCWSARSSSLASSISMLLLTYCFFSGPSSPFLLSHIRTFVCVHNNIPCSHWLIRKSMFVSLPQA